MVVLFLAQNIETTKFFFIKTALLKSKIITIFVKFLHKSFVSWNKKSSLEYTFNNLFVQIAKLFEQQSGSDHWT